MKSQTFQLNVMYEQCCWTWPYTTQLCVCVLWTIC